ncbi:hypothetical protein ACM39_06830 [Chryseobacterium sp. FH2]|uniref:DUF1294 domain-containing protein n=1 Tax=Chryseobacterium sp. FH2 TaxID=1674291 RepID=UPI00065AE620|nr:DUF1294 domain-containing protein [Chryseobacterium sp. FH2]KMQ68985.1 hypothetical protein ACM39_06830 [Chryseobacterium sp. FH2]
MFYLLTAANLFSFIVFGLDKRKAIRHQRRISENNLLLVSLFGGTIGAICGMLLFRHKISKFSFLWKFGVVVLVQVGMVYLLKDFNNQII